MKNMISGASHADYGVFVVPASPGEFETATGTSGQLMQQATLAKTMGISYGIVAVNKMDLHNYDQSRYEEITRDVAERLRKIGYKPTNIAFIPLSGWIGDNIMEPSENTPWYKGWEYTYVLPDRTEKKVTGKTLYDYIDTLNLPPRHTNKPLRGSVNQTFKIGGVGTVVVGRIDSGKIKVNDLIHMVPGGITSEIKSIEMHHKGLQEATPGDNIGFNLKNVAANDVRRGYVFGHQNDNPPREAEKFTAQIMALEKIGDDRGIRKGMAPTMDVHTAHIPIVITDIISVNEKKSKKKADESQQTEQAKTGEQAEADYEIPVDKVIKKDGSGLIEITPSKPLCVETYLDYPALGRFSLRDSRMTIAVGIIKTVTKKEEKGKQAGAGGPAKGAKAKGAAKGAAKAGGKGKK
ncbi:Elongation factor 1-alpha 2 [Thelohanellus kitauei]|uniref:Elongation factor 1-alpha 2 n=1 Tax=Thelohanellus kitauei TaxID=669202 RepID=A0A0C2N327_THEKT|nr:Elongation factor 1-alpha 2 [Thelohanellus kitauei]